MANKRIKDQHYLEYIRTLGCLICRRPAIAHHLMHGEPSAMSARSGDNWAVPLCDEHHRSLHGFGNEQAWWTLEAIDPVEAATHLWSEWVR